MDFNRFSNSSWLYRVALLIWIVSAVVVVFLLSKIDTILNVEMYKSGLQFSLDWADPYWTYLNLTYVACGVPVALSLFVIVIGFTGNIKKVVQRTTGSTGKIKGVAERFSVGFRKVSKSSMGQLRRIQPLAGKIKKTSQNIVARKPEFKFIGKIEKGAEDIAEREPEFKFAGKAEESLEDIAEVRPKSQPVASQEQKRKESDDNITLEKTEKPVNPETSCPNCKKTFSRPMVMLDFQGGKSRLVNVCPYCDYVLGRSESQDSSEIEFQIADLDEKLTD